MGIRENIDTLRERIERARARAAGGPVRLVAVSKTFGPEAVREAFACGIRDFGENRIQEALPKIAAAAVPATWHLVGHLQGNKANKAADAFAWVQSLDSLETAERLNRRLAATGKTLPVLVEVNTSGEANKHGLAPDAAGPFWEALAGLSQLEPRGLMTVGPLTEDEEAIRRAFRLLRALRDRIAREDPACRELSMGMSGDFETAIEEGATIVRVGGLIFGTRA